MNNLSILTAASVGMAGIVLNGKTTYRWREQKKPNRWINSANYYITRSMWHDDKQQSKRGEIGPFADGPGYFEYAFESAIPFFIAWNSFFDGNDHTGSYDESLTFSGTESVRNYMYDQNYDNLYQWYNQIRMPNTFPPTYDDSWQSTNFAALGLVRTQKILSENMTYNIFKDEDFKKLNLIGTTGLNLYPDFMLAVLPPNKDKKVEDKVNLYSGDIIIKSSSGGLPKDKHYIHINAEKNEALNGYRYFGLGHEHGDALNFVISAGEDILTMDPGYLGYENRELTNQGNHHNIITSNYSGITDVLSPDPGSSEVEVKRFLTDKNLDIIELKIDYHFLGNAKLTVDRTIQVIRETYYPSGLTIPRYHITDRVSNLTIFNQEHKLHLNGNGNSDDATATFIDHGNKKYEWKHPCIKDHDNSDNWKLLAYIDVPAESAVSFINTNPHGGFNTKLNYSSTDGLISGSHICDNRNSYGAIDGKHSQLLISKTAWPLETSTFQMTLQPWPCDESVVDPVRIKTRQRYTAQLFDVPQSDGSLRQYHFTSEVDSAIMDTNALCYPDTTIITKVNAKNAFFSYSTNTHVQTMACVSELNFRRLHLQQGDLFIYNDTTYIEADHLVDVYYEFKSKMSYWGYVNAETSTVINFYIPDGEVGYDMIINGDGISSAYDDGTRILSATVAPGYHKFQIQLADPCSLSCYFPPTEETIDDLFLFDDGSIQTLSHKLDIVKPYGNLVIGSSQMELSCGIYLHNEDSLILMGECDDDWAINPCEGVGLSYQGTQHGALIVNDGTALVLDNGSYTRIGNNTAIIVKSGGTLVVGDGAVVEIGDNSNCDKGGKLIIEPGASFQIHPYAHIEFHKLIGDTVDRNIFNISLSANTGIDADIDSLLRADTLIDTTFISIPVCSLNTVLAPAVYNNDWGYANFMPPATNIRLRNDTICPGEVMIVDLRRVLNDKDFWFEVCRMDSVLKYDKNGIQYWADTCIIDTVSHDTVYEVPPCKPPRITPDYFFFQFKTSSIHRLTFKLHNECGLEMDSVTFVHVLDSPKIELTMPATACPGVGGLHILTDGSSYYGDYSWSADRVDTLSGLGESPLNLFDESANYHADFTGLLPDTFSFPDFYFVGGSKYVITLTAVNGCGSFEYSDTVKIPVGARIELERPTAYAEPINGAMSIKLHGYANPIDSFEWMPTTWLDTPTVITPVSTPLDSITYVLITHSGECIASDTVHIRYNRVANAGYNDSVCFDNNQVLIGNMYDMALFLGYLYYYNPTDFKNNWYYPHTSLDPTYFRYFTHFMMHDKFYTAMTGCGGGSANAYDKFIHNVQKDLFFKEPWYADYYKNFIEFSNPNMPAFDDFVTNVSGNTALKDNLDSITYWGEVLSCMDNMFNQYDDFLSKNIDDIHVNWDKIVDGDTSVVSAWDEYFIGVERPDKSTVYRVSVITPSYAEIDEITVLVDTALSVGFSPLMQFDSTVFFGNFTEPVSSITAYEWNFGDGSPHVYDLNPIHEFPAFDTNFVVCLTASNVCGSWMFCDTVWIDSAHWGGSSYRAQISQEKSTTKTDLNREVQQQFQKQLAKGELPISLINYPNPFTNTTTIDYQIWQSFVSAELRITNVLGQEVIKQKLSKPIDKIQVDGSQLFDGLYYYSIIIDGSVKLTKIMSVIH